MDSSDPSSTSGNPPPPPSTSAEGGEPSSSSSSRRGRCFGGRGRGAATWGSATTVGRRKEMEDAVALIPELPDLLCDAAGGCLAAARGSSAAAPHVRFYGVYDGHGGAQVANYCARRMHEIIAEEWQRLGCEDGWQRRWEMAFTEGFNKMDNEIVADAVAPDIVGSTALVVVLSGCQIIVSNCGDSRAILCRGNQIIQLTVDHKEFGSSGRCSLISAMGLGKPDNKSELARIEASGGRVVDWQGLRVSAILAVSRALGDRYLRPWIIPVPETTFTSRTDDDECLIIASDGLWDVISNNEVGEVACRLLRRQRRNGVVDGESQPPAQVAADHLVKLAYNKNSTDNISVIVVDLKCRATRRQQRAGS